MFNIANFEDRRSLIGEAIDGGVGVGILGEASCGSAGITLSDLIDEASSVCEAMDGGVGVGILGGASCGSAGMNLSDSTGDASLLCESTDGGVGVEILGEASCGSVEMTLSAFTGDAEFDLIEDDLLARLRWFLSNAVISPRSRIFCTGSQVLSLDE